MDPMQIFSIVMTSVTGIIVALIGAAYARREIKDKKYKDISVKLETEREERRLAEETERNKELSEINATCVKLSEKVNLIEKQMGEKFNETTHALSETNKQVEVLVKMSKYNLEFSNEMNNALMNLSECIIDGSSGDTLRNKMQEHRDTTNELSKKLYNINF